MRVRSAHSTRIEAITCLFQKRRISLLGHILRQDKTHPMRNVSFQNDTPILVDVLYRRQGRPHPKLQWSLFHDVDLQQLGAQISSQMAILYGLMSKKLQETTCDTWHVRNVLAEVSCIFGVIVWGALFQKDSPFGRFRQQKRTVSLSVTMIAGLFAMCH